MATHDTIRNTGKAGFDVGRIEGKGVSAAADREREDHLVAIAQPIRKPLLLAVDERYNVFLMHGLHMKLGEQIGNGAAVRDLHIVPVADAFELQYGGIFEMDLHGEGSKKRVLE